MTAISNHVGTIVKLNPDYTQMDAVYLTNKLLNLIGDAALDLPGDADPLTNLDLMVKAAQENGKIPDSQAARQILEAQLMDLATPTPSRINQLFWDKYQAGPRVATDWFFALSRANNYIQTRAIAKNVVFPAKTEYGDLEITINLSKPEKDPKDIAAAAHAAQSGYPACALCLQTEGYAGRTDFAARTNHRIIRFLLGGKTWGFQYSPYAYFNEHAIFLDAIHEPMVIDQSTFSNLLAIVSMFPTYFVGSNADLPIVGGSMLTHEHYQGGRHTFPMAKAPIETQVEISGHPHVFAGIVKWPMSVIRLVSADSDELINAAEHVRQVWNQYTDETVDVRAFVDGKPHHTVTPIARRVGSEFQLDLVLRDNQTSAEHPDGIFHPHQDVQHIKTENIGLIEVMGRAILPARLKSELAEVQKYLLGEANTMKPMHKTWADQLKAKYDWTPENVEAQMQAAVGRVFARVLEDAGVFKRDEVGQKAFARFCRAL